MLEVIKDVSRLEDIGDAWKELAIHNPVPTLGV
ncbi:hypothetical protein HNQ75_004567 [Rhizobium flavum]|uniref:Uncharacterized protein n=1 Tax=Pseudorhizobium flavum TaxID=1335061 RepID=A0A7W9Z1Z2_9HYPH|nr:hypothetical protein [Pseudorhizobium flavum]